MSNRTNFPSPPAPPLRVLMVCLGNICRSPTAQGVLERRAADAGLAPRLRVDSAGTHSAHVGEPPDARSQAHAARRGYDLSGQRARQLLARDFTDFDLVLVMDGANERAARALCPPAQRHKLRRLTDFCTRLRASEVPDPYCGGDAGFERVLDLIEDAGVPAPGRSGGYGCHRCTAAPHGQQRDLPSRRPRQCDRCGAPASQGAGLGHRHHRRCLALRITTNTIAAGARTASARSLFYAERSPCTPRPRRAACRP